MTSSTNEHYVAIAQSTASFHIERNLDAKIGVQFVRKQAKTPAQRDIMVSAYMKYRG